MEQARADPALMMKLMRDSQEADRAKRQRLGALVSSVSRQAEFVEDGLAMGSVQPRNYKRERSAREAAASTSGGPSFSTHS